MTGRGERLHQAMLLRGFRKQHALAHLLGVTESTITRWKRGQSISVDHAIALCAALDISLDWFLRGIGAMEAPTHADGWPPGGPTMRLGIEERASIWRFEPLIALRARYNH